VHRPIIDGERWLRERLSFLRAELERDHTDHERVAIQAEIDALASARPLDCRGGRPGFLGRFFGRR
jgi:hypothetical protein